LFFCFLLELQLKDLHICRARLEVVKRLVEKGQDKTKKQDVITLTIAEELLANKKDIRSHNWGNNDVN
jgi:ribosome-binding ATPase YchF (GTP1/OBG family)